MKNKVLIILAVLSLVMTGNALAAKPDRTPCFDMWTELSVDGSEVLVYANNACESIVKLVKFKIIKLHSNGSLTNNHWPDVYIEQGKGVLIHREPYLSQYFEIYLQSEYFTVDQFLESDHLLP